MTSDKITNQEVAREILEYLIHHPRAADTFDNVVQWWILHQRYLRGVEAVKGALDLLMDQGQVVSWKNPDGTILYGAPGTSDDQVQN